VNLRRSVTRFLLTGLLGLAFGVEAQPLEKVPRIGFVTGVGDANSPGPFVEAFRQGLRELGYIEGKNILVEYRYTEGKQDRSPSLVGEFVHFKVDVIVTGGSGLTAAAKEATTTIPIVMAQDPDPIGNRFVASLARPGGNITGLSNLGPELTGKRLELLKEVVPSLSRVTVFGSSTFHGNAQILSEAKLAGGGLRLQLQYVDVREPKDIEIAFREAKKGRAEAVLVLAGPVFFFERRQLAGLAVKSRLPAIYYATEFVEDGGLITYGANRAELHRRASVYVDKILKGAKPADLPIEQPTKFELVINLRTAKQIGLTIPPNVLARADRVIK
jgi:putative ABC transport system substrate-binding protein